MHQFSPYDVLLALEKVYDPCSVACRVPMNVVEMGLVESVSFEPDDVCRVTLILTAMTCFQVPNMQQAIEDAVLEAGLARSVEVDVNHGMLWSPELMAERARVRIEGIRKAAHAVTGTRRRQWKEEASISAAGAPSR